MGLQNDGQYTPNEMAKNALTLLSNIIYMFGGRLIFALFAHAQVSEEIG